MKHKLPDIEKFEQHVFKSRDALSLLLSFSQKLLRSRRVGLLYGTNKTYLKYLPPEKWDRGVMHKFNGFGWSGLTLKLLGKWIVRQKGLSPVMLYERGTSGALRQSPGIISYVLRKHKEFYGKGVKILVIDIEDSFKNNVTEPFSGISLVSYDGRQFQPIDHLMMNNAIVRQFRSHNFVSAYVPDYGAIVFDTIDPILIARINKAFSSANDVKKRLNILITAIEMASLAHLGRARGRKAAHIIWHKEKYLRKVGVQLEQKQNELSEQRKYLKAVGAVTEQQLNMEAIDVPEGVYAFMDMVGSATIRKSFAPKDYFFLLNLCHQIAADNAAVFSCRVDNFIGDCVFIQSASVFDVEKENNFKNIHDRIMVMLFALSSIFNQIEALKRGDHPLDPEKKAAQLIKTADSDISFRAGMEIGSAMIGPLGSQKRKVVTAIGKSVNNASRLESSGLRNHIHVSEATMKMLETSTISIATPCLSEKLKDDVWQQKNADVPGIPFFKGYKKYFGLNDPVVTEQKDISYKEFKSRKTFLIRCIP